MCFLKDCECWNEIFFIDHGQLDDVLRAERLHPVPKMMILTLEDIMVIKIMVVVKVTTSQLLTPLGEFEERLCETETIGWSSTVYQAFPVLGYDRNTQSLGLFLPHFSVFLAVCS